MFGVHDDQPNHIRLLLPLDDTLMVSTQSVFENVPEAVD